jgi:hypothetical protein
MASNRIKLQLKGLDIDHGDVRLNEFIKELAAFKRALSQIDRIASAAGERSVYFRIVDLRHDSPASVTLEAVAFTESHAARPEIVIDRFYTSLEQIERGVAPIGFDYRAYQAFKDFTKPLGRALMELGVATNGSQLNVTQPLAPKVETILGPDEIEYGSISGMLQQINLHGRNRVFTLYPLTNQPPIRSVFRPELRRQAVQAVDQYIYVSGELRYKRLDAHPYRIIVDSIEPYEGDVNPGAWNALKGSAPEATGSQTTEEFVRGVRDAW